MTLSFVAVLAPVPAEAIVLNDPQAAAVGGVVNWYDVNNQYANVASIYNPAANPWTGGAIGNHCTGTLINSRTILTASHCLIDENTLVVDAWFPQAQIRFAPDANGTSANDRLTSGVLAHPLYTPVDDASDTSDIGLISLSAPLTALKPVMLIQAGDALPAPGTLVRIVGYGQTGTGSQPEGPNNSRRRAADTTIGAYGVSMFGAPGMINIQFRDPQHPDAYNDYAQTTPIPQWQGQPGSGDSGGPLFMVMADGSLVQIGTVNGGGNGYGARDAYANVQTHLSWLAANNPLRFTTAGAGAFNWSDTAAWTDTLGRNDVPNNVDGHYTGYGMLGRYYEAYISNPTQLSVDMSPTIDRLIVANDGAKLNIPGGVRLGVVLDAWLIAGGVAVDGALDAGQIIQTGGVMSGAGRVATAFGYQHAGGVIAPGSTEALGVLTIQGSYIQSAGASLAVRLDAAGSDRLVVTGAASLAGTLALSPFRTAPVIGQRFTVLQADAVAGSFSQVASALPAFAFTTQSVNGQIVVTAGVDYSDDVPVYPALDPDTRRAAEAGAQTLNEAARRIPAEQALAAAMQAGLGNSPLPATPALAIAGLNAMDAPTLGRTLLALPPAGFHGQSAFGLTTSRIVSGALADRLAALHDGAPGRGAALDAAVNADSAPFAQTLSAPPRFEPLSGFAGTLGAIRAASPTPQATPFGLFVSGSYLNSGSGAEAPYTASAITAGMDTRISHNLTLGAAVHYVNDLRSVDGAKFDSSSVIPTLYGRFNSGLFFIDGYLGYGFGESATRRVVPYGNLMLNVEASPRLGQWLAGAIAGVRLDHATSGLALPDGLRLTPFVGVDLTAIAMDRYVESGAGALSVTVASRQFSEARTSAGIEAAWDIAFSGGVLTPRVKASITQAFGDKVDSATAAFALSPDLPFALRGDAAARTYGTLGAALAVSFGETVSGLASYQANIDRNGLLDNRFTAKAQYRF